MSAFEFQLCLSENIQQFFLANAKVMASIFCNRTSTFLGTLDVITTDIPRERLGESFKRMSTETKNSSPKVRKVSKPTVTTSPQSPKVPATGFVNQNDPSTKRDVSSLINTLVNPQTNQKIFQCSFCSYQSNYMSHAKRHVELKHLPTRDEN